MYSFYSIMVVLSVMTFHKGHTYTTSYQYKTLINKITNYICIKQVVKYVQYENEIFEQKNKTKVNVKRKGRKG